MHSTPNLLASLYHHLPRIAEEGGDREEVSEAELIQVLADRSDISLEVAEATVAVARSLFQALSLFDERSLAFGQWAFVSFPASLMARSVLKGLDANEFRLLEPGFWDVGDYRVDRQRALIKLSEELRAALPAGLVPIRRVWVSWAWLALDDRFLLVRREDSASQRDGSRGQFVFPGGRVSAQDLAYVSLTKRLDYFDPNREIDSNSAKQAFIATLRRELHEELDISSSDLEVLEPALELIHYNALEGGKSAFSATEYRIQPFKISLTSSGKTAMLRCLASHPDRFEWFTLEELAKGINATGAEAFVDAIRPNISVLDSSTFNIAVGNLAPISGAIDIPGRLKEPFSIGINGREKQIHIELDAEDISTLNWLASVRRGENVSNLAAGVSIAQGCGWVIVEHAPSLARLKVLAAKLQSHGLPLLDFHERAVRLNVVSPYFSPSQLSIEILDERRGTSYRLTLSRRSIRSLLGVADAREITTDLPPKLGSAVYALAHGDLAPALDNVETVKRMQRHIRSHLDAVGARLLVREVDGVPELAFGKRELE